jgi:glucose/arabinose dehydrogenase
MDRTRPRSLKNSLSLWTALPISVLLFLSACGSEGQNPRPPAPINANPVFEVAGAVDYAENGTGIVLQVRASDPDGEILTYQIVAGTADAARFALNEQTGDLRFVAPPDFESPMDENADNVYQLSIRARDGVGGLATLPVSVTVTDVVQTPALRRKASGLTLAVYLTDMGDGSGRVLVATKYGQIVILDPETETIDPVDFAKLNDSISSENERGLLGLALAPDFSTSRALYVNVTNLQGDTEIRRYTLMTGRDDMLDPSSLDVILKIEQPFENHNSGWIGFDANGYLVIPTGDGGSGGDPGNRAQDPMSLLGKVLRLDISGDDFPADPDRDYAIPPGNTFSNLADGRPEIFAVGLRNPYRSSFDPATGDLLIADVGQDAIEEVSRLPMDDSSLNFGWRVKEGTQDFTGSTTQTLTPPVLEYSHGAGPRNGPREGSSIIGGYVYTGPVEALQNEYIFSDFSPTANFWSVPVADMVTGSTIPSSDFNVLTTQLKAGSNAVTFTTSFGTDAKGNLYLITLAGDVYRLEAETP